MHFLSFSITMLNPIINKPDVLVISNMLEDENGIICSQYIIIIKIIVGLSFHGHDHCQNIRWKYHIVSRFHHQFLRHYHLCSWNNFCSLHMSVHFITFLILGQEPTLHSLEHSHISSSIESGAGWRFIHCTSSKPSFIFHPWPFGLGIDAFFSNDLCHKAPW